MSNLLRFKAYKHRVEPIISHGFSMLEVFTPSLNPFRAYPLTRVLPALPTSPSVAVVRLRPGQGQSLGYRDSTEGLASSWGWPWALGCFSRVHFQILNFPPTSAEPNAIPVFLSSTFAFKKHSNLLLLVDSDLFSSAQLQGCALTETRH